MGSVCVCEFGISPIWVRLRYILTGCSNSLCVTFHCIRQGCFCADMSGGSIMVGSWLIHAEPAGSYLVYANVTSVYFYRTYIYDPVMTRWCIDSSDVSRRRLICRRSASYSSFIRSYRLIRSVLGRVPFSYYGRSRLHSILRCGTTLEEGILILFGL